MTKYGAPTPGAIRQGTSWHVRRASIPLALLYGLACTSPEPRGAGFSVTDSAGITIVTSDTITAGPAAVAVVEPAPDLDPPADTEAGFFYQVAGLVPLGDGFGVINRSTGELRMFDTLGNYRRSLGALGDGPGEFRHLWFASQYRGDSVLVHDGGNQRFTVFDPSGAVARTFFPESREGYGAFITPIVVLPSGNIVVHSRPQAMVGTGFGTVIDSSVFGTHDPDGRALEILGRWPSGARMRVLREGLITILQAPFAATLSGATRGDGFCLGFGATFDIRCHDSRGRLRSVLRLAIPARPVTADVIDRYVDAMLGAQASYRQHAFRRVLEDVPYPTVLPVHARMVGDEDGGLWVETYRPFDDAPARWWRLDERGHLAGSAVFPARFAPYIFRAGVVRGVWRDSVDVEHVRTYRVRWPGA